MELASLNQPEHDRTMDLLDDNRVECSDDNELDEEGDASEEVENEYDEEEDEPDEEEFKQNLQDCLDNVMHPGTFSSSTTTGVYINPGLRIGSIGTIGLPLSVRDAQAIAGVCKQSPFGKGDETVVDENVRKTWELDADEFTCCNPAWQGYIDQLSRQATQNLGVEVAASAQTYKLLLYEEGAFFRPHRDTEKVPGMFGTMVVCLPSEHTGGEVQLVHNGKQQTMVTATTSAHDLSALAWYSDVQHEIKPVTSGYRLVLTYNLVQDESLPRQTAARICASTSEFEELLQTWHSQFWHQDWLVYPLEHRYTPASLSLKHLKGQDAARGRFLEQLCTQNDVYWFLAQMTKEKQVDEDEYDADWLMSSTTLQDIVTPVGKPISLGLHEVEDERILGDVGYLYEERDADSEDEAEFTGNASAPANLRYHDTVAIMMPKGVAVALFGTREHHLSSLLAMFGLISKDKYCHADLQRSAMKMLLRKCCHMITWREDSAAHRGQWLFSYLGRGEETQRKREEYAQGFELIANYCYANELGDAVAAVLHEAVQEKNWHEQTELVDFIAVQIEKDVAGGKEDVWSSWLHTPRPPVLTFKFVEMRRQTFDTVKRLLPPSSKDSFEKWSESQLNAALADVASFTADDAIPVLNLLLVLGKDTFFESIMPKIVARPHIAGILRLLYHFGTRTVQGDEATRVFIECRAYKQLLPILTKSFKLSISDLTTQSHEHSASRYYHSHPTLQLSALASEYLGVVQRCMYHESDFKGYAKDLLASGLPNLPTPGATFEADWRSLVFFLKSLVELLQTYNDTGLNEVASNFIKEALRGVAAHFASSRPKEPRDWSRPNAQLNTYGWCQCGPCQEVKKFLVNPVRQVASFSYPERIRKHIQSSLNNRDFRFETERSGLPYTLIVSKTTNEYARTLEHWKTEIARFRVEIIKLRSGFLSNLLGGDVIVVSGLDGSLLANGAADGMNVNLVRPLQPTSSSAQNSAPATVVAGMKRKAEVVDLTEDYPL